jgi:hypothetical protein
MGHLKGSLYIPHHCVYQLKVTLQLCYVSVMPEGNSSVPHPSPKMKVFPIMYLHLLTHSGKTLKVLNTRQRLTTLERADMTCSLLNPTYAQEMNAHRAYMALPGKPDRFTRRVHPVECTGVGVLSTSKKLNQLSRFEGNGQIKASEIPTQLRGEVLLDYLDQMVGKSGPPCKAENLKSWVKGSCPVKVSSVTDEQVTWAKALKAQGVSLRKSSELTGIPLSSLHKLVTA